MNYTQWLGDEDNICPIDPEQFIEVITRDGKTHTDYAGNWRWSHFQDSLDITEYRKLRKPNGNITRS